MRAFVSIMIFGLVSCGGDASSYLRSGAPTAGGIRLPDYSGEYRGHAMGTSLLNPGNGSGANDDMNGDPNNNPNEETPFTLTQTGAEVEGTYPNGRIQGNVVRRAQYPLLILKFSENGECGWIYTATLAQTPQGFGGPLTGKPRCEETPLSYTGTFVAKRLSGR